MRRALLTGLVALMVVLAGCGATTQGTTTGPATSESTDDLTTADGSTMTGSDSGGTLTFYLSDEPAAIDDFEHLNVTITEIGLHPKTADSGDSEDGDDATESEIDEENETDPDDDADDKTTTTAVTETIEEGTTTTSNETTTRENETATAEPNETATATTADANETTTTTTATSATTTAQTTEDQPDEEDAEVSTTETEADGDDDGESTENGDENEKQDWITYAVDDRTVDLTELKGANATRLADLSAPAGEYNTVFVYVSEVEGVLENGEEVNVKLPSQKLQLHKPFRLGPNATTEFVYDIAVHEAGKSGKYILKPNIAQSGTEVEIEDVDREEKKEHEEDHGPDGEDHDNGMADEEEHGNETAEAEEYENETAHNESESGDVDHEMPNEEPDNETETDESNDSGALSIAFLGNVTAGENVTIEVTNADGAGVAGADVEVNGELAGTTDGDGQLTVAVPADAEELEIEVQKAKREGETTRELSSDGE